MVIVLYSANIVQGEHQSSDVQGNAEDNINTELTIAQ